MSLRNAHAEDKENENVFVKPNGQCQACLSIAMARKRTFRGTRKEGFCGGETANKHSILGTGLVVFWYILRQFGLRACDYTNYREAVGLFVGQGWER